MDSLKNMMAEMEKMQQQMQEMAEKQAADAANEENKPAVKIADLELIARKLSQTEEAVAELYTFTEKISAVENAMQEVSDLITGLKQMLLEGGAQEEEDTLIEDMRATFLEIINKNKYIFATSTNRDDEGEKVFSTFHKTITGFITEMKKYAHYNKKLHFMEGVIQYAESLYRTIYNSKVEEYCLYRGHCKVDGELLDNRSDKRRLPCDKYGSTGYVFGSVNGGIPYTNKEQAGALNSLRQGHLTSMQNEAMELILAEVAKYI